MTSGARIRTGGLVFVRCLRFCAFMHELVSKGVCSWRFSAFVVLSADVVIY